MYALCVVGQGGQTYIHQLHRLEAHTPAAPLCLPAALVEITIPLLSVVWEEELADHPDQVFASYVVSGIKQGFRVGNDCSKPLASCSANMVSALQHPDVVLNYLGQELLLNRMVVVHPVQVSYIHCHISPFGVIPKRAKPGQWRLIVDLSSPSSASVNDGIDKDMCSVSYVTVDQVVDELLRLGPGALMGKVDITQAHRIVPVHPDDRHLFNGKDRCSLTRSSAFSATYIHRSSRWPAMDYVKKGCVPSILFLDDFNHTGTPTIS